MIREIETGGFADDATMTVSELCGRWLEATRYRVAAKTHARYESIVRLHIVPAFGALRVDALRPSHIETALVGWITGPRKDRSAGQLTPRSVKHLLDTLRTICRWGLKMRVLTCNPVDVIDPPKVPLKEMRALDATGVSLLVEAALGSPLEAPIVVAIGTGLRRGALLALRWSDIDFEASRLSVRRSVETVEGSTRTKAPKTARSARTIAVPYFVMEIIKRARSRQLSFRLEVGLGRCEDGWVFSQEGETLYKPGAFSLHFARLLKRHGLPHIRFHDLRHSFGTLALASGVDLKTVSAAMGHSTIAMTANTYTHAVEALDRAAADRMDLILGDTVRKASPGPEAASLVPRRCHGSEKNKKKPRLSEVLMVAPTGVEPESRALSETHPDTQRPK